MITNGDVESHVRERLNAVVDPYSGRSVAEGRTLSSVNQEGGTLRVSLSLGYPARTSAIALTAEIKSVLADMHGVASVDVAIDNFRPAAYTEHLRLAGSIDVSVQYPCARTFGRQCLDNIATTKPDFIELFLQDFKTGRCDIRR